MLWFVFFAVAFLYYGVVLLTTEIHLDASSNGEASPGSLEGGGVRGGDDSLRCTGHGSPDLPRRAFLDIFVSAVAELPGLAFCALALDALGRRRTLGSCLLIAAVCVLVLTGHREIAAVTEASALAAARCFAMAAFTALYVYAPETQTTATRATALGVGNAFARVGGMLTPLFAVEMVGNGNLEGVAACFAALAAVTAAVAFFLPVETAGCDLDADAADDTNAGDVELVETATDSSSPRVT
jgi:MFS family permease